VQNRPTNNREKVVRPEKPKGFSRFFSFLFKKRKEEMEALKGPESTTPEKTDGKTPISPSDIASPLASESSTKQNNEIRISNQKEKPIKSSRSPEKKGGGIQESIREEGPKTGPEPKIRNLDLMDEADLIKAMTGEEILDLNEARNLMDVGSSEKMDEEIRPPTKLDRIKAYPKEPQDELDLHQKTADEAARLLRLFILGAAHGKLRKVRIITGKGLHSENGQSVIKEVAENKIQELMKGRFVFAFEWERPKKSTSGAMIVYLA
jgi:DNA-nicking Smr family endonuclease